MLAFHSDARRETTFVCFLCPRENPFRAVITDECRTQSPGAFEVFKDQLAEDWARHLKAVHTTPTDQQEDAQ